MLLTVYLISCLKSICWRSCINSVTVYLPGLILMGCFKDGWFTTIDLLLSYDSGLFDGTKELLGSLSPEPFLLLLKLA
jgi:hypothetical protein